jgi:hypothetical protein
MAYHGWQPGQVGYPAGGARSLRLASVSRRFARRRLTGVAAAQANQPEPGPGHCPYRGPDTPATAAKPGTRQTLRD